MCEAGAESIKFTAKELNTALALLFKRTHKRAKDIITYKVVAAINHAGYHTMRTGQYAYKISVYPDGGAGSANDYATSHVNCGVEMNLSDRMFGWRFTFDRISLLRCLIEGESKTVKSFVVLYDFLEDGPTDLTRDPNEYCD